MMTRNKQNGLTLIEVLVGIIVGLISILAIGSLLIVGNKQTNDTLNSTQIGQDMLVVHRIFDQHVRSAGAGFMQGNSWSPLGCYITSKKNGLQIIPITSSSASSSSLKNLLLNSEIPLTPVLIAEGIGHSLEKNNHILLTMSGSQNLGGAPQEIIAASSNGQKTELLLNNNIGFYKNELAVISSLIPELGFPDEYPNCFLTQIENATQSNASSEGETQASSKTSVTLGGQYHSQDFDIANQSKNTTYFLSALGKSNNNFNISFFGVENKELKWISLLEDGEEETIINNVISMQAEYGITEANGNFYWQKPIANYSLSSLLAKSRTERSILLKNITAVRLFLEIENINKQESRTIHFTIPLRNALVERDIINP